MCNQRKSKHKTVLLVDDDAYSSSYIVERMESEGYEVLRAKSVREAKDILLKRTVDLAMIDIMLPLGEVKLPDDKETLAARGGYRGGQVLAAWVVEHRPKVKFLGYSVAPDEKLRPWFRGHGSDLVDKSELLRGRTIFDILQGALISGQKPVIRPVAFIIHGHDETAKLALKNYLQNTLDLPEPIILHEQPSRERTIIEKLEQESEKAHVAFVLLTPDDKGCSIDSTDDEKRRARQNVIFEMGYFLGRFSRKKGRVVLLHKGPIELPSDISGLAYIDIAAGIEAAGEQIRRELSDFLEGGAE